MSDTETSAAKAIAYNANNTGNMYTVFQQILSGELTVFKQMSKSEVWEGFDRVMKTDTQEIQPYVICKYCERIMSFQRTSSTSNLRKHTCFKIKHAGPLDDESSAKRARTDNGDDEGKLGIWNYFEKDGDIGKCVNCRKLVRLTNGSTFNLKKHLLLKHESIYKEYFKTDAPLSPISATSTPSSSSSTLVKPGYANTEAAQLFIDKIIDPLELNCITLDCNRTDSYDSDYEIKPEELVQSTTQNTSVTNTTKTTIAAGTDEEIDLFFKSIALSVSKLKPNLRNIVKMKCLQALCEAEEKADSG